LALAEQLELDAALGEQQLQEGAPDPRLPSRYFRLQNRGAVIQALPAAS
jgi:hypothetical protein